VQDGIPRLGDRSTSEPADDARKGPLATQRRIAAVYRKESAPMTRRRIAHAAQIAALVLVLILVPTALAGNGKGGGGTTTTGSSTLTGPVIVHDLNGNGYADHGDSITFNVSTTATSTPTVGLRCYQNGVWVYDEYLGFYSGGYWTNPYFTLDSTYWITGASASCTARLFYYDRRSREQGLATLTFPVGP
jgi:hypothetical protein